VNQSLMAVPMLALYLLSIGIAWVFGRRKSRRIVD
jgi:Sec-independent protein secretion pathway component TatC